jgi:hypothetical protein
VKRCPKSKDKKSVSRRKKSKNRRNSTINFQLTNPKMEEKAMFSLVMKRLTIGKKMKSSLQSKSELLQEENRIFNLGDSIINMYSIIIPNSNISKMLHQFCSH